MTLPVTDQEIKDAVFSIGDLKSLGPDGFSICLWDIIGNEFSLAIKEFFESGRIKPCLEDIVSHAQSAFVKQRSMIENIYLVQEIVRKYARNRVSPRCLLQIDLKKAYDSMSWKFIKETLEQLKFPRTMVKWVMQCVSTPTFSLFVNGGYHGFVEGRKGLRQEDPISPLLIGMKYLSRLLIGLENNANYRFHPRCEMLKLSHLAFANDLIFFSRGDSNSVKQLLDCLGKFSNCSGLIANNLKSNFLYAGIKVVELEHIRCLTEFQEGNFPFKHLGIPLAASRLNKMHYAPLINKIFDSSVVGRITQSHMQENWNL
ncbi:uncharacterized protein LOC131156053 [Malania oleifera]|uniref:uncharacterized protein LOC131156053 n=1 Tax=Malania oleifera TaxID=397392 RepID=UPI0025AE3199|nr:uncharacterized protein LOC131156053 [Malania oleifera]